MHSLCRYTHHSSLPVLVSPWSAVTALIVFLPMVGAGAVTTTLIALTLTAWEGGGCKREGVGATAVKAGRGACMCEGRRGGGACISQLAAPLWFQHGAVVLHAPHPSNGRAHVKGTTGYCIVGSTKQLCTRLSPCYCIAVLATGACTVRCMRHGYMPCWMLQG